MPHFLSTAEEMEIILNTHFRGEKDCGWYRGEGVRIIERRERGGGGKETEKEREKHTGDHIRKNKAFDWENKRPDYLLSFTTSRAQRLEF